MARPKAKPVKDESFDGWVSKADVIRLLQLSEKTVERMAQAGTLRQGFKRMPGRRPLPVFHPDDVEREREKTVQTATETLAVANAEPPRWLEPLAKLIERDSEARADQSAILASLAAAVGDLQQAAARLALPPAGEPGASSTTERVPLREKALLTLHEVSALTGLSESYLQRACASGRLKGTKVGGWRVRPADLDAFLNTL